MFFLFKTSCHVFPNDLFIIPILKLQGTTNSKSKKVLPIALQRNIMKQPTKNKPFLLESLGGNLDRHGDDVKVV